MRTVHSSPVIGLIALVALVALIDVLDQTVGVGGYGWTAGLGCGLIAAVALARGLARHGAVGLGPADRVTLGRSVLAGGVAALAADSSGGPALVTLAALALALDGVDGWVARRTRTGSAFGAHFDMEADAFLILALSGYVARSTGAWVLAIGLARYAFVAAGWVTPWLRRPAPPRYWCKVVATIQGVTLAFVAADVAPRRLNEAVLAVALALLVESFGCEVGWLWSHRACAALGVPLRLAPSLEVPLRLAPSLEVPLRLASPVEVPLRLAPPLEVPPRLAPCVEIPLFSEQVRAG